MNITDFIDIAPIQMEQEISEDGTVTEFTAKLSWRWKSEAHKQQAFEWAKTHVVGIQTKEGSIFLVAKTS